MPWTFQYAKFNSWLLPKGGLGMGRLGLEMGIWGLVPRVTCRGTDEPSGVMA